MNDGLQSTTAGHNSGVRASVIRDICGKLDEVDAEIRELQERRGKIKGRIKADLGMKIADFNVLRRFRSLEDERRDALFNTLREGFQALGIGVQSSFLTALDETPAPAAEGPKVGKKKLGDAYQRGYTDSLAGKPMMSPYVGTPGTKEAALGEQYNRGWREGEEERAAKQPDPPATAADDDWEGAEDESAEAAA